METKYKKILPSDVFITILDSSITVNRDGLPQLNGNRLTGNDFINLFAQLIHKYGNLQSQRYASMMGVDAIVFSSAIVAMTGIGAREWICGYLDLASCELLEKTDLPIAEISKKLNFSSAVSFSQFFYRIHKCYPSEWGHRVRKRKKK